MSRLSRSTARPLERDRPGLVGDQGTRNEMESTILGQKRVPKVRKMSPEIVPGGSGSPLGPPWEIFRNNGWLKYGFGEDFDRQRGGQEGPKGSRERPKSLPRALFWVSFSTSILRLLFYRFFNDFFIDFGIVFGAENGAQRRLNSRQAEVQKSS